MSSFSEFYIAQSGLFAAQRGMSVTANNITNMGSPGYSRQVLNQQASKGMSGGIIGVIGTGVETTSIKRVRDSYLDQKMWSQNDMLGEYSVKVQQNELVESVFGEPSDAGFTKIFTDLFNGIDDLSKLPSESERKQALRQNLISFSKYFNSASESLSKYQRDLNFEIKAKVDEINMLATRIQSLNKQIYQSEMHGENANTLRDDRDLMVDRLSEIVNVEAKEVVTVDKNNIEKKEFVVTLNGQNLVDNFEIRTLTVKPRVGNKNPEDIVGLYDVEWSDGLKFDMGDSRLSGELKGLIDMRDGRGTTVVNVGGVDITPDVTYKGIPYYISRLDTMVKGFAEHMNEIYNKDENGNQLVPPLLLFEVDLDANGILDYSSLTAKTFKVSDLIMESASNIRTNYTDIPGVSNPNPSNNDLLMDLLGQKDNKHMFKDGDPKDYMISVFSELGINTAEAKMYKSSQTNIKNTIESQRKSVSQVSQDEEFMNLVKYNQAYQAAAKIITTMDEIYDLTIQKMGVW